MDKQEYKLISEGFLICYFYSKNTESAIKQAKKLIHYDGLYDLYNCKTKELIVLVKGNGRIKRR